VDPRTRQLRLEWLLRRALAPHPRQGRRGLRRHGGHPTFADPKLINPDGVFLPPTATFAIGLGRTGCHYPNAQVLREWWRNAGIRHNGGMTLVMYDGHAKWVKEEFLLQHPEWFIAGNHNIPADELVKFNATGR